MEWRPLHTRVEPQGDFCRQWNGTQSLKPDNGAKWASWRLLWRVDKLPSPYHAVIHKVREAEKVPKVWLRYEIKSKTESEPVSEVVGVSEGWQFMALLASHDGHVTIYSQQPWHFRG